LREFLSASHAALRDGWFDALRRMTPPRRTRILRPAALAAALCLGAGGGAAVYAAFASNGGSKTTVVRQVTVKHSQPAASVASALSVHEIYQRSYRAVVKITVNLTQSSPDPFGGSQTQQAQASGFVYDNTGDIVTNEHVVDGATSVSVKFWNGATYKAHVV